MKRYTEPGAEAGDTYIGDEAALCLQNEIMDRHAATGATRLKYVAVKNKLGSVQVNVLAALEEVYGKFLGNRALGLSFVDDHAWESSLHAR